MTLTPIQRTAMPQSHEKHLFVPTETSQKHKHTRFTEITAESSQHCHKHNSLHCTVHQIHSMSPTKSCPFQRTNIPHLMRNLRGARFPSKVHRGPSRSTKAQRQPARTCPEWPLQSITRQSRPPVSRRKKLPRSSPVRHGRLQ